MSQDDALDRSIEWAKDLTNPIELAQALRAYFTQDGLLSAYCESCRREITQDPAWNAAAHEALRLAYEFPWESFPDDSN